MTFERVANCVSKLRRKHWDFSFLMSWGLFVPNTASSTQSMLGSLKPPIFPAAYFHGNKSIMPDMAIPVIHMHTHTHHNTTQQGKHAGMWKFTEQNPGIKNRDGCRMYKYGGGSEDLSTCGRLIRTLAVSRGAPVMEAEVRTPECSGGRRRKLNQRR